ncbi:MAG TPA: amine dehydrogenase [Rhodocyclaceae bacterium]|nr:MAG: amine dehydrogenase [Betaproteobacteria bacterium CG2_30_68_42]PIX75644.1 MAG: amine dehydrogenase [Rhodocyclales bacterium CG_4_10_14_3_um_filter_68_10]PJA56941.1 MAG: amine dehydrogenase [Rhodocyclales bacterium CG_4_9_14_3_um_filter_68_10]HCX32658.1 amine dehydrogenase [Rhodocyclaceae bacterium]
MSTWRRGPAIALAVATLASGGSWADVAIEQVTTAKLAPATPHRVYVTDVAISHIVDGRVHVVDGDSLKYLGMIASAYAGQTTLSQDGREFYVATTYYSRLSRGERTDVVDIYDTATLAQVGEIPIPPKHAQALNYKGILRTTRDGRFLLVQNATPATSVSVVDLKARKFVAEIPTPGCWTVIPSQSAPQRFAALCGDGSLLVVTLDGDGRQAKMARSAKFFDPDDDPLFVQSENLGDEHLFVSFKGKVYSADLSQETPRFGSPWSLVTPAEAKKNWRPGGYQPIAVHRGTHRLFVTMHPNGKEGSHKDPAQEIWVFDFDSKARIQRVKGANAVSISASQDDKPLLFALDGKNMGLVVFEAANKLVQKRRLDPLAETAFLLETQP